MPLNLKEATDVVNKTYPGSGIDSVIEYQNLFIFNLIIVREGETGFDPFYSVNRDTGEMRDFSIITDIADGDHKKFEDLFLAAKRGR